MEKHEHQNDHKLLTCEMIAPDSSVFCELPWMQDLEQAERDGILTLTKTILNKNIKLTEEDHAEYNRAFKPISNTTAGGEIKGVTVWSNKTKEKQDTDQFYLPTLMAELTEIETGNEEDYWEDISLIVTQEIQHEIDT